MLISDFDFDLPEDRIALRPAEPREAAKLLRVDGSRLTDSHVGDIADFLLPGDVLIVNDTRVLPTQLDGVRLRDDSTVSIEATLVKSTGPVQWQAFLKPGRKVKSGDDLLFKSDEAELRARVSAKDDNGLYTLDFYHSPQELLERLHVVGGMPLPPYIRSKRHEDEQDNATIRPYSLLTKGRSRRRRPACTSHQPSWKD